MSEPEKKTKPDPARYARYAALAGVIFALACQAMPPRYQTACHAVAQVAPLACGGH